jgi:hypothetical protein
LAGPLSPTIKEANSSGLGVQWTTRPESGNSREDDFRMSVEAPRRNIPRYFFMAE